MSGARTSLDVEVTRVVFPREADDPPARARPAFTVMLTDAGKCVGMLPFRPAEGARLTLVGEWAAWHGERNFRFRSASLNAPRDPRALLDYVCRVGRGLGPKTAEAVWAAHGADWQRRVDELRPATAAALRRTLDALGANRARLDLAVYCVKMGLGPSVADRAWAAWGAGAAAAIEANPYALASLPGVGFRTADAARAKFGVADGDARRALAAADYAVSSATEASGDSVVPRDAVYEAVQGLGVPRSAASAALARLVVSGRVVYVGPDAATTSAVVRDEGGFARYVVEAAGEDAALASAPVAWPRGFLPDPSQERAVRAALSRTGLTVVNGPAGTGKTTVMRALADALDARGEPVDLCAFAGKAAARLREATGRHASTIHSLLGWTGEGGGFRAGSLRGRTVVVDEASMVPSSLLAEIARREPRRLVLVGDQAQLQPVGAGAPFHDLCDFMPSAVFSLDVCHRARGAVLAAARAIREGALPRDAEARGEAFAVERVASPEAAHARIMELVRAGRVDFAQDLVLSPRNGEGDAPAPATVNALNADIGAAVNPHAPGERFRAGDRVMMTRNFPGLDLWNGTAGWVSRVDTDGRPYFAPDGGREARLGEREQRDALAPAYCLTVHKSQGSQYRDVWVVALRRDAAVLLDRPMLYTAVTRARRACHVLCDDGLARVVGSARRRRTYLGMLLRGEV